MKTTYQDKYKNLEKEVIDKIIQLIHTKGIESEFQNNKVLKVNDKCSFNLDCNVWLSEVSTTYLLSNEGYEYNFSSLTLEQLCEIADSFL